MGPRGLGLYQPFQFHEHDNENILTLTTGNVVDVILTLAEQGGVTNPVVSGRTGLRTLQEKGPSAFPIVSPVTVRSRPPVGSAAGLWTSRVLYQVESRTSPRLWGTEIDDTFDIAIRSLDSSGFASGDTGGNLVEFRIPFLRHGSTAVLRCPVFLSFEA